MEGTTLELKYCECCGALGLRRPHSSESYCERCARLLTRQIFSLCTGRGRRRRSPDKFDPLRRVANASPALIGVQS